MAPSGAGKTTLFRILMGLETADSGTIEGLEGRSFSAVFQEDRLLEGYTVLQNIRFVTGRGYPAHELTAIIKHLLPEDSLKKPVSEFSGGMKRRTAILRAILAPADIVLMDDDPLQIAKAIKISRKCIGIVRQNIVFSLVVKFGCLALVASGVANMWAAIFADVGVMVLAVLNAIRALKYKG